MPQPIDLGRIQIIKALMDSMKATGNWLGESNMGNTQNRPLPVYPSQYIGAVNEGRNVSNIIPIQEVRGIPENAYGAGTKPAVPPMVGQYIPPEGAGVIGGTPEPSRSSMARPPINFFRDVILPMLPSLISTGVGMAVPGALAGAAGFNQGYGGAMEKEKDRKAEELRQYIKDNQLEDVFEYKGGKLTKADQQVRARDRIVQPRESIDWLTQEATPSATETGKNVEQKFVKPSNIPDSVWNSTTDKQKQEYLETLNGR